jgi:hypothetical protein
MTAKPATKERYKTMHYKRARIMGGEPIELGVLMRAAFKKMERAGGRIQRRGEDGEHKRVADKPYEHQSLLCGWMLDYTEGDAQPTISFDPEELEITIGLLPPRDKVDFLRSVLFFGVEGDHVIVMQHQGSGRGNFEGYLNWLLVEQTEVLTNGRKVVLDDFPPRRVRERLRDVRSIMLEGSVSAAILRGGTEDIPKPQGMLGGITQRIQEALHKGAFLENEDPKLALKEQTLRVGIEIRLEKNHRKAGILDEVAHVLRNVDDDVIGIRTKSGKLIQSGDLRLWKNVRIRMKAGFPEQLDVGTRMHEWLVELKVSGELDGDV